MKRKSDDFWKIRRMKKKTTEQLRRTPGYPGRAVQIRSSGERADRETAVPAGGSYSCRSAY